MNPIKNVIIGGTAALSLALVSCEVLDFASEQDTNDNNYASLMSQKWQLLGQEPAKKANALSEFDSILCISDIPYGEVNGVLYRLDTLVHQYLSSFTDFTSGELWHFAALDSLTVFRKGSEPIHWDCQDGEPQAVVSPGFISYLFTHTWTLRGDSLLLEPEDSAESNHVFLIQHLSDSALTLLFDAQGLSLRFGLAAP
ncbi:MAG: hypothetical protein HC842_05100, partial [Cytophagales bacterium]|nr:hypothetical protein [Cytophagales bacterium]